MQFIKTTIYYLLFLSIILLNACSSYQTVSTSNAHLYNTDFGIIPNPELDAILEQEILSQNKIVETEIDYSGLINDPTLTTIMTHDPEAVTLENYVEPEPIITYKYMHSSKFFREDELPENKLLVGDVIY